MIVKTNLKLGAASYQFEVDDKEEMESLHKAIVLANPKRTCICGDASLDTKYFVTNKDQEGNIYVNVKCSKCGAKSKLGRYKAGGYFWHDYEIYKPKDKATQTKVPSTEEGLENF